MNRKIIISIILTLLIADIGYSFLQHYTTPFDGDMAGGIVPGQDVVPILKSPFGLAVFSEDTTYANPNKFFCHWSFYAYFNQVPLLLQHATDAVTSAYLSCAIIKTLLQLLLILVLATASTGRFRMLDFSFLLAALFVTPLFQTNGYRSYMGIIDQSTTYTFFYALPTLLIILYFLPLFLQTYYKLTFRYDKLLHTFLLPFALVISLSGPLNAGIALIVSLLLVVHGLYPFYVRAENKPKLSIKAIIHAIPAHYYFYIVPITFFSLYSLFIGQYNSLNISNQHTLITLYAKLPAGIYYSFFQMLGFPVLLLAITINILIIRRNILSPDAKQLLSFIKWIGIFALLYILLLPLGGYRSYRPYILRYDTLIPITLCLMFVFAKTSLLILSQLPRKQIYLYLPLLFAVLFIFTNADTAKFNRNSGERNAIAQIVHSNEKIVKLDSSCTILSWTTVTNPHESELVMKLLKRWKIVNEDKLFYQSVDQK